MNNSFHCEDKEAIVAFLYDECGPGERERVAEHVTRCARCAEELAALAATRTELASWTPPAAALGFRLADTGGFQAAGFGQRAAVSGEDAGEARNLPPGVLTSPRWWQRPLPAWAQAAAAAAIFGAGLMLGGSREAARAVADVETAPPAATGIVRTLAAGPTAASPEDLARLEARLRAAMKEAHEQPVIPVRADRDDKVVVERVRALIAESEERQRQELALRTAALVRDFDLQRRADLQQVQLRMGQLQGATGLEVREQREALRFVMNQLQGR